MKFLRVVGVLLDARCAMARMFGSKMMSCGSKPDLLGEQLVGALADLDLALDRVGLPISSKAMTTTPAP